MALGLHNATRVYREVFSMLRVVLAAVLLVSFGCSKQQTLETGPGRKEGWTDGVYRKTVEDCKGSLDGALNSADKAPAICTCYADLLSTTYSVEELNTKDYAIQRASESTLVTCAEKNGESVSYGIRAMLFFREPMQETPEAIKNTLSKVKKKDPHAGEAKPKRGSSPDATVTGSRPPLLKEKPKKEVFKGNAKVKYNGYNLSKEGKQSESFFEKEIEFTEATCVYDHRINTLIVIFRHETSPQRFDIVNFDPDQHNYTMSGAGKTDPMAPGDELVANYGWVHDAGQTKFKPSSDSESTVTSLKLEDSKLSGKIAFRKLLAEKNHASAAKEQNSVMDIEGDFSCAYSVITAGPLRIGGPKLKVPAKDAPKP